MQRRRPVPCPPARAALLTLAAALGAGCLQERPPINRVQPDYLDKRDFIPNQYAALVTAAVPETLDSRLLAREPVFYNQNTIIAKPTTTGFAGLTRYSDIEKVRWEVTERLLIARRAYEFVRDAPRGSNGIGNNPQSTDPVAMFRITSHFDIRRSYNNTTGEELNVVEENALDRPWYQRRFMRVDWSENAITGYNTPMQYEEWQGKIQAQPVPVFVNTPSDPNAPLFVFEGVGEGRKLTYFDVVNRAVLHPETTLITFSDGSSYPKLPVCWLWFHEGATDCAASEITYRNSFVRVDPDRDYEPASLSTPIEPSMATPMAGRTRFPFLDMERFGVFDASRIGYDRKQHATLDNKRLHFATRHNLWLHHHALVYGADGGKPCNADRDCAGEPTATVCRMRNDPVGPGQRGTCAALALAHDPTDPSCESDDDCRQTTDGEGVSRTSRCDTTTHTCGEHYVRCGADADCAAVDKQSTCDLVIAATRADNRGLCLMPFRQRQVRPIAYHESQNYPDYMQAVTEQVLREWNDAFAGAVISARRHECELDRGIDSAGTPIKDSKCSEPAVVGLDPALGADARNVVVGCHSPVWGTGEGPGHVDAATFMTTQGAGWDLPACGPQGTLARIGDIRYSMVGAITDHDNNGYWGLADIAADPETGEMVAGRGAVWQTVSDGFGAYLVQLIKLLNGDASPDSIAEGDYVLASEKQLGTGASPSVQVLDAPLAAPGGLTQLGKVHFGVDDLLLPDRGWFRPEMKLFSRDPRNPGAMSTAISRLSRGRVLGDGTALGTHRLLSLAGSTIEARMMNSQQARLAPSALPDETGVLPDTLRAASPVRLQSLAMRRSLDRFRQNLAVWQCNYEAAFSDDMLLGLANRLKSGAAIKRDDPEDPTASFGRDWNFKKEDGSIDYALMQDYAAQFVHHGVLAHELGHSVGQRHNFTGSADAINYFDTYWKLRGKGHPKGLAARYEYVADPADKKFYSAEEIAGRIDEWGYSSVMDYKGLNEDSHGLGRYDIAYVKNTYVGMVEAFRKVADQQAAISYGVNVSGTGLASSLDLRNGQVRGFHYTQIPQIYGTRADGTPNISDDNRYDVFLRETDSEPVPGWGDPGFTNVTRDKHVLVPYRFDTDNRAGLIWQVQRYDNGADAYESLHYVSERLLNYYFINSFARLRSGFSIGRYQARMHGRYLDQLQQCTQTLAFDIVNYADFFAGASGWTGWEAYKTDPTVRGGYINRIVMAMTADTLIALLTMPEMGGHAVRTEFDGTRLYAAQPGNTSFNVPINEGRAFESNWRFDAGFWWYEMLNRAGSYYDKVMAVQTLSDPSLNLISRDTPTDIRQFQLSFYTMFPEQMLRLFGAILAEDYADYAPIRPSVMDTQLVRPHIATINLPYGTMPGQNGRNLDPPATLVDPQTHFTMQLYSAVHTMTQFPATYDQRYLDFTRLWVDGSEEEVTLPDPQRDTVWFTDPWSHTVFRALHVSARPGALGEHVGASPFKHAHLGDAAADETGIAARMLLHVKDLDFLRLEALAQGKAPRAADIELAEKKYIDLLHVMRDMTARMGHGVSHTP